MCGNGVHARRSGLDPDRRQFPQSCGRRLAGAAVCVRAADTRERRAQHVRDRIDAEDVSGVVREYDIADQFALDAGAHDCAENRAVFQRFAVVRAPAGYAQARDGEVPGLRRFFTDAKHPAFAVFGAAEQQISRLRFARGDFRFLLLAQVQETAEERLAASGCSLT